MSYPHKNLAAAQTLTTVAGASGKVDWLVVENTDAAATVYLKLYSSSAAIVGTTVPLLTMPCAVGVSGFSFGDRGVELGTSGVHYAVTAGRADNNSAAPPSTVSVNLGYG